MSSHLDLTQTPRSAGRDRLKRSPSFGTSPQYLSLPVAPALRTRVERSGSNGSSSLHSPPAPRAPATCRPRIPHPPAPPQGYTFPSATPSTSLHPVLRLSSPRPSTIRRYRLRLRRRTIIIQLLDMRFSLPTSTWRARQDGQCVKGRRSSRLPLVSNTTSGLISSPQEIVSLARLFRGSTSKIRLRLDCPLAPQLFYPATHGFDSNRLVSDSASPSLSRPRSSRSTRSRARKRASLPARLGKFPASVSSC
ncbi:hypothetical protein OF846_004222 [Rhodotorula toruloides]|nr:hypothetical protein OF846_004222 [Rhodotorula toruloides]KAJ8292436.1 hypothetical protein OF846_004222 [Rhodotorula toruloides]